MKDKYPKQGSIICLSVRERCGILRNFNVTCIFGIFESQDLVHRDHKMACSDKVNHEIQKITQVISESIFYI